MNESNLQYFKDTKIQFIDGDRGKNYPSKSEFIDDGHCLFLDTKNVTESGFNFRKVLFISKEKDQLLANGKLQRGDIVLTSRGTLGNLAFYGDDIPYEHIRINSGMLIVRTDSKEYLPYYLYIFLQSDIFKRQCNQISSGSAQPQLPVNALKNASILKKDLINQRKIEQVIRCLDDKIELNIKINAELEAMAKLIYDYWFVQFDFPDKNGKPYKASGGKMIYNEVLKREIPVGWHAAKLKDVISRCATGLNPRNNFNLGEGENYYITIKSIENGRIIFDDRCDFISDESLKIIDERSNLQVGDVLFTSIQPVGVTYLIQEKPTNWNINESVFTIRANPERITSDFLYMMLSSTEIKTFTKQSSTGSVHKGIRHGVLKDFNLPYGGKGITESFTEAVNPILMKSFMLDKENQQLNQLRDWLLPMLITGQLKINPLKNHL
tara:strand:- start:30 stop:1343 length:1314 start_codon:yes stop_codon:yes gene_type:complete